MARVANAKMELVRNGNEYDDDDCYGTMKNTMVMVVLTLLMTTMGWRLMTIVIPANYGVTTATAPLAATRSLSRLVPVVWPVGPGWFGRLFPVEFARWPRVFGRLVQVG